MESDGKGSKGERMKFDRVYEDFFSKFKETEGV